MLSYNTVAVVWINRHRSILCKRLNIFAGQLQSLCIRHQWLFRASYIPGPRNTWADALSRAQLILSEWVISQASFLQLLILQSLQVDLFARPGNYGVSLPVFGGSFRHPWAAVHDVLTTDWNRWSASYLFPQLALVPVCHRILHEFVGRSNFVAPALPSALWWPVLIARCSLLELPLQVHQLVRGVFIDAQEAMSLTIRAFKFQRKYLRSTSLIRWLNRLQKRIMPLECLNMRPAGKLFRNGSDSSQQEG